MRASRLIAVVLVLGLTAAGCGSKPPAAPATTSAACTQADGPSADTVAAEIAKLPSAQWSEIVSGHTADCSLHWVVVTARDASDSPIQASLAPATDTASLRVDDVLRMQHLGIAQLFRDSEAAHE